MVLDAALPPLDVDQHDVSEFYVNYTDLESGQHNETLLRILK